MRSFKAYLILSLSLFCMGTTKASRLGPPIFLASIPKAGSHLIKRCLNRMTQASFCYPAGTFFNASERELKRGVSLFSHAPYNKKLADLIAASQYKGIFMVRDPRDQAVSFAHFIPKNPHIWPHHTSLEPTHALTSWIQDTSCIKGAGRFANPHMNNLGSIADFYARYMPWSDHPDFYTVHFEKLVGRLGGGSDEEQEQEIRAIAAHLGIELTDHRMQQIVTTLFDQSRTFRAGKIGSWRTTYTPEQKKLFKEVAGNLLIELGYETDHNW